MNLLKLGAGILAALIVAGAALFWVVRSRNTAPATQQVQTLDGAAPMPTPTPAPEIAEKVEQAAQEDKQEWRVVPEKTDAGDFLMTAQTWDELQELLDQFGVSWNADDGVLITDEVEYLGEQFIFMWEFDSNDRIVGAEPYAILFPCEEVGESTVPGPQTPAQLKTRSVTLMENLIAGFGGKLDGNFTIAGTSGALNAADESAWQQVLDGTATVQLRVKDTETGFWELKIETTYRKDVVCWLFRSAPGWDEPDAPPHFVFTR